jgi:hypothetical protein
MKSPGLTIRPFKNSDGTTPEGSSGWVHLFRDFDTDTGHCMVSEASCIGRFWPARYDPACDWYVKIGIGVQWKDGAKVATYT